MKTESRIRCLITAAILGVIFVTVGCGRPEPPPQGPPEVAVMTVRAERAVLTTELPGRTTPYRVAEIRPQVNGVILKRAFREGSDVKAGSILYQIDPAPYQAAFDQAQASYAMAEANIPSTRARAERLKGLVTIHAVGQQDYDDAAAVLQAAEAGAAAAKAAMENARINLDYTPIKAPISGRIGRSSVTEGALVMAYQPVALATIQQLDPIYVDVPQSTTDLLRLQRHLQNKRLNHDGTNKVGLILEDGSPYPLEGTLQFRDVTVDPTTGSITLRMVFPNPDHILLPGMFVGAIVEEGVNEEAFLVPQQGVARDPKGNPIGWIVGPGESVEQRALELDRAMGDKWLVTKGLAVGDRLIVEGLQKIRPGDTVKAVPFTGPAGDGAPASPGRPSTGTR